MADTRPAGQAAVGLVLVAAAVATFIAGRVPLSIFVALLCLVAYRELQGLLVPSARFPTLLAGGAAVAGYLWFGYRGRLIQLPWVPAVLVLVLLALWVVMHEATGRAAGATEDISGTVTASALVGLLGAHVLLIRAVPRFGAKGVLAFGLMVLLNDAFAFVGGRALGRRRLAERLSPGKTVEGVICGFLASVAIGAIAGFAMDPPFDPVSGVAFGAALGVLAPIGDLAFSAIKRSAGLKESGRILGPLGGVLDGIDALLFCAPAFYWAFRTIAL